MINEELTEKDINLAIRIGKISYDVIKKAVEKLIAALEEQLKTPTVVDKTPELKHGKQTLNQLKKHHEGLTPLELTDPNLRLLNSEMKKAKIDFSVSKDGKGKYLLHFKGKDADEMTHALKKYTQKLVKLEKPKPSISKTLAAAKAVAKTLEAGRDKVKNRSKGARDI
jgi:hypothetical protein